jgi:hypothetical protein
MCGSARVVMTCRMAVPDYDDHQAYTGIVDFESDRCRLDGEPYVEDETEARSVILDGSTTYAPEHHGRWTFTRGAAGTHGMLHPRGLLDALVHAQTSVIASGEHSVEVGLDHEALNAAAGAGLAPDWESTAVVQLSPSGRIARVTLTHRSREDPNAWIQVDCSISEPDRVGAIDLPASEMTISLQDYIEQEHGQPDS